MLNIMRRANQRHISMKEIESVLKEPEVVKCQGPKYILAKHLHNRRDNDIACVVLEKKEHDLWVVVTVMHNFQEK